MSVPRQACERSCICVIGVPIFPLFMILEMFQPCGIFLVSHFILIEIFLGYLSHWFIKFPGKFHFNFDFTCSDCFNIYTTLNTHTQKQQKKKKPHTPIQVFMFLKVILFLKFQNKLFLICKSPGSIFLSYIMRKYANQCLVILENIH